MLTDLQMKELRVLAKGILEQEKWEVLPWSDALNGAYAIRPTEMEIDEEAEILRLKATRIMAGHSTEKEYSNPKEHVRMIYLESANSFNIYASKPDS